MGYGSPGGAELFVDLKDTPAAYAGQALKPIRVNAGVTALEFTNWLKFTGTKIFDGQTASPPTRYLKPVTMYPNINPVDSGGWLQRSFAVAVGGNIYVGGGRYRYEGYYNNQWWKYNIATAKWTKLQNLPANYGCSVNWRQCTGHYNGKIYILTQYINNDYSRKLLEYDIAGDSWAVYDTFGSLATKKHLLAACTDYLYLARDELFQRFHYDTHALDSLTSLSGDPLAGGNIADEVYAVVGTTTYKYNKGTTNWDNQAQAAPATLMGTGSFIVDVDELWALNRTTNIIYKYTPAGGWVSQFTYGRDSWEWGYFMQLTGEDKIYCYFDDTETHSGFDDLVACGSVHVYDPASLNWCLLAVDLVAGDFIVVDTGGVPILVEKDGVLKWTCTGLSTFFVMESGRYYFTLSKDYTMINTKIWKSVWG